MFTTAYKTTVSQPTNPQSELSQPQKQKAAPQVIKLLSLTSQSETYYLSLNE